MTTNVGLTSELPALPTARRHPVAASEGLRNGSTAVELSTMFVVSWCSEHSVGWAVFFIARRTGATTAGSTAAVPVAGSSSTASEGDGRKHCVDEHN